MVHFQYEVQLELIRESQRSRGHQAPLCQLAAGTCVRENSWELESCTQSAAWLSPWSERSQAPEYSLGKALHSEPVGWGIWEGSYARRIWRLYLSGRKRARISHDWDLTTPDLHQTSTLVIFAFSWCLHLCLQNGILKTTSLSLVSSACYCIVRLLFLTVFLCNIHAFTLNHLYIIKPNII